MIREKTLVTGSLILLALFLLPMPSSARETRETMVKFTLQADANSPERWQYLAAGKGAVAPGSVEKFYEEKARKEGSAVPDDVAPGCVDYVFTGVKEGEVELRFAYADPKDKNAKPKATAVCRIKVWPDKTLEIIESSQDYGTADSGMSEAEIVALFKGLSEKGDEIFWWYMGDGSELDGEEFGDDDTEAVYPVKKFKTVAELKYATAAVYSREFRENILFGVGFGEGPDDGEARFLEINGKLHVRPDGGIGWIYELTDDISVKSNEENEIVVTVICIEGFDEDAETAPFDFTLVREDGVWKLDNWFDYDPEDQDEEED